MLQKTEKAANIVTIGKRKQSKSWSHLPVACQYRKWNHSFIIHCVLVPAVGLLSMLWGSSQRDTPRRWQPQEQQWVLLISSLMACPGTLTLVHAAPTKCPRETSARFHGAAKPGRVWRTHYRSIGAMDSTPLACTTPGDSMHGLRNTSYREWCSLWLCKLWAEGKKQKRKDAIPPLPRPSIREARAWTEEQQANKIQGSRYSQGS